MADRHEDIQQAVKMPGSQAANSTNEPMKASPVPIQRTQIQQPATPRPPQAPMQPQAQNVAHVAAPANVQRPPQAPMQPRAQNVAHVAAPANVQRPPQAPIQPQAQNVAHVAAPANVQRPPQAPMQPQAQNVAHVAAPANVQRPMQAPVNSQAQNTSNALVTPQPPAKPVAASQEKKELSPEEILAQIMSKTSADTFSSDVLSKGDAELEKEAEEELKSTPLGEKLIYKGLISKDQLETALKEQRSQGGATKKMIGAILIEMGFITESALGDILTEESGVKVFDSKKTVLDSNLIRKVPQEVAMRYKAVPISTEGDAVMVLISDIYNILAIDQIRLHFSDNTKIIPVYGSESEILEIIDQYYGYETSIEGILKEIESGIAEQKVKISGEATGYTNPTVRLVDAILVDSIKREASDIHLEPESTFLRIRYRIDGKLVQIRSFHKSYWPAIVVRLKIMSGMNIAETRNPQDGRVSYNVLGRDVDFRVATHPTVFGENIVMRLLDKQKALVPLEKLGFSKSNEALLFKLLHKPEGIIIVTGPTGSGKTTTLYSVLNYINSVDINIMTLENPVEYQLAMIRQADIKEDKGMDFVSGIKSLMRQDPDVIFVGEIRDKDTATMAMRAAMTGHRVFSTLHTNDAYGAIPRLIDVGVPGHLLSGTLICVIAQRLLRKLCKSCKLEKVATEYDSKILGIDPNKKTIIPVHSDSGCADCSGSGYKGRVAAHEIFPVDKSMDELISTGASRRLLVEAAATKGYIPILQDGIDKVLSGITDVDEIIRVLDATERL